MLPIIPERLFSLCAVIKSRRIFKIDYNTIIFVVPVLYQCIRNTIIKAEIIDSESKPLHCFLLVDHDLSSKLEVIRHERTEVLEVFDHHRVFDLHCKNGGGRDCQSAQAGDWV